MRTLFFSPRLDDDLSERACVQFCLSAEGEGGRVGVSAVLTSTLGIFHRLAVWRWEREGDNSLTFLSTPASL